MLGLGDILVQITLDKLGRFLFIIGSFMKLSNYYILLFVCFLKDMNNGTQFFGFMQIIQ